MSNPMGDFVSEVSPRHLANKLERRMRQYEARYELRSDQVEAELQAGRLRDTAEICDWVIAYHTYQRVQNG